MLYVKHRRPRSSTAADSKRSCPASTRQIDAVSARALAPLEALLGYAEKFIDQGAVGVFSKGKQFEAELTDSLTAGKYLITTIASQTCPAARLVLVRRRAAGVGQFDLGRLPYVSGYRKYLLSIQEVYYIDSPLRVLDLGLRPQRVRSFVNDSAPA